MKLLTFDPDKQKEVIAGVYDGITFYKNVSKKHFMRIEQGYGIQEDIVSKLQKLGCEKIRIIEKSSKKIYDFPFDIILNKPTKNYGSGEQRFIRVPNNKENK